MKKMWQISHKKKLAKPYVCADLFCGAGGTSAGAVEAIEMLGYTAKLTAINHWETAVATHSANHPEARHLCASLDSLNPRELFREGELDLLWASPECTHHSVARGGKPINDQSRATAWCVARWAEALRPSVILVENVPEFRTWGPLIKVRRAVKVLVPNISFRKWKRSNPKGTRKVWTKEVGRSEKIVNRLVSIPDPKRKGEIFHAWLNSLRAMGYTVDYRILVAADYGDPTTRRRLFVQAVRGRRKIVWPSPTHTQKVDDGGLFKDTRKPWVPARDIIDWSTPGQSIFERKRPLSPKTMRRIWAGLEKFGLGAFITPGHSDCGHDEPRTHSVSSPLPTVLAQGRFDLVQPYIITMEHGGGVRDAGRPLPTITCAKGGAIGIAKPYLIELRGTSTQQIANSAHDISDPLSAVATSGAHHALTQPYLVAYYGDTGGATNSERRVYSVDIPVGTITTENRFGVAEPFLIEYYGNSGVQSLDDPLNTVTCKDRNALVRPIVIVDGERYLLDIRFRMLQPHELAAAQGFRKDYKFTGTKTEQVKQIGNAVPRRLARALVLAAVSQNSQISKHLEKAIA